MYKSFEQTTTMLYWLPFFKIHIKRGCDEAEDSGVRNQQREHVGRFERKSAKPFG